MCSKVLGRCLINSNRIAISTRQTNLCSIFNRSSQNRRYFHVQTNTTIFEIGNGVGGSEAMLFADDMFEMYSGYFSHKRWPYRIEEHIKSELGGIKSVRLLIEAKESFPRLLQEAGVHRVQRVPKTEKNGRMHTSTITVSVIPKSVLDIKIHDRDIEVQTKMSSGPGGQHVNKTESAVRLTHRPSGVVVDCQESRHQIDNRKIAMRKLLDRIQTLEMEKLTNNSSQMKKLQVGLANRNEKIRTYNFPQDRITDHRIGKTYYNLKGLFAGDIKTLDKMIDDFHQSS